MMCIILHKIAVEESVFTNVDSLEYISRVELKFQAKLTFALQ